jgi:hypothetical protein
MSVAVRKPRRAFLAVTVLTVISLTTVFLVYAAILATYKGGSVTVNTIGGQVWYATADITGPYDQTTLTINNGTQWWARLVITNPATQTVSVTWTLVCSNSSSWSRVTTTGFPLSSSNNVIYATSDGSGPTGNYNWGQDTGVQTGTLTYYVKAQVSG